MSFSLTEQQLSRKQIACWQTALTGVARSMVKMLAAGLLLGALFVFQLISIGVLDRLEAAPQLSFLSLNLALIATLTLLALYPLLKGKSWLRWRGAHVFQTVDSAVPSGVDSQPLLEIKSKILIIRRLEPNHAPARSAKQTFDERTNTDATALHDWLTC